MSLADELAKGLVDTAGRAASLIRGGEDISPEKMNKALSQVGLADPTRETPRAMFHDPFSMQDWGGWRERPSQLTYETLRQLSIRNTIIAAIIQVRVNQVAQFARPQQSKYDKGFKVILRDRRDAKRQMSPAEERQAAYIERMLETTGFLLPNERASDRDSFRTFVKKAVRDVLTYDQLVYERIRDRRGRISRFQCLPANTIRPAVSDSEHMLPEDRRDRVAYVQVYEETVIAEFTADDIAWSVMNPRSDIRTNGFGFSPVEQLMTVITAWLFGFTYNQKFFSQGSAVKGILNIKGAIPDRQLKAFRRMWYAMVSGVENSFRTPILNAEELQWHSMHSTNRDMEFGAWMDWLTKITCAVFGIDPVEINFVFGASGVNSTLNQQGPNEQQVVESKDKGLRPLMDHLADSFNQNIIWEINPDFEFAFTGLDAKAEDSEREGILKEVKAFRTVDEVRAHYNLDPLPGDKGQVILDPNWLQHSQGGGEQESVDDGDDGEAFGDGPFSDTNEPEEDEEAQADDGFSDTNPDGLGKGYTVIAPLRKGRRQIKRKRNRQVIDVSFEKEK